MKVLTDVVVDTNVFVHADNEAEQRHEKAVEFLECLLDSETSLVLDSGFDLDPGKNESLIGQEYLKHLGPTTLGHIILSYLAQNERTSHIPRSSFGAAMRNAVNQMISNTRDRTFVLVAANTCDKVLCSHDFRDFPARKRRDIERKFDVAVIDAEVACARLGD